MTHIKKHSVQKCPTEREDSMAVMAWARLMVETGQEPRLALLRCGFEGLRLSMGLRMQVKKQSISTGWPDLSISVACHGYHGCFVEVKRLKGGVLQDDQKIMHELLREQGYYVEVCKGADATIRFLKEYLDIK
jgi:hypothetical protein